MTIGSHRPVEVPAPVAAQARHNTPEAKFAPVVGKLDTSETNFGVIKLADVALPLRMIGAFVVCML